MIPFKQRTVDVPRWRLHGMTGCAIWVVNWRVVIDLDNIVLLIRFNSLRKDNAESLQDNAESQRKEVRSIP
jgi:hypothetical protein